MEQEVDSWQVEEFYEIISAYDEKSRVPYSHIIYGYWLTDVLERAKRYKESTDLAKELLLLLKVNKEAPNYPYDKIRFMIGLSYSLAIGKITDRQERLNNLRFAKETMDEQVLIDLKQADLRKAQKKELLGMYYSDYGALEMNGDRRRELMER